MSGARMSLVLVGTAILAVIGGTYAWTVYRTAPACTSGGTVAGDIGGPFTLISETGRTVTERDVITKPTLVYFGYTYCPDVCPLDTARNAAVTDILAERGYDVAPVFITVDPARDTPEVLEEFTNWIHPALVGLTGSEEQIREAMQAFRVYGAKQDGDPEYYLVDHTTFTYLMMPGSGFVDFYRRDLTPEEMADRVACSIDSV